ncbi:MAG: hypothetical protein U0703_04685 [Anaerolineae bacterium]
MAAPIYKLWMARTTEAWYQLSSEEQNSLLQKVQDTLVQVGGKSTVTCDSSWSSEQWVFLGSRSILTWKPCKNMQRSSSSSTGFDIWTR